MNFNSPIKAKKLILVVGATGGTGRLVVQRALEMQMQVRVFVRNVTKAQEMFDPTRVQIQAGALDDVPAMAEACDDVDAVVTTLASFEPPHNQMSTAMTSIVEAAKQNQNKDKEMKKLRVFHYGVCGFQDPDRDFRIRETVFSALAPFLHLKFGNAVGDHRKTLRILEESSSVLNATVFQTPAIDYDKPLGTYHAGSPEEVPGMKVWNKIGGLDAADACLQRIDQEGPKFLNLKYNLN